MSHEITETEVGYARTPGARGASALKVRLFRPPEEDAPYPLLIWLHSGGFRSGSIGHRNHRHIGRRMAEQGYATAFLEYRLRTPVEYLSKQSRELLPDLQDDLLRYDFGLNPYFTGPAAIAAMEDCIVFFQWLDRFRDRYGLTHHVLLGGSSSGAITALNTLFLPPHLGIRLPRISSAFIYSGAFAYPSFYQPTQTRILAVHSDTDVKMPIASIRRFATEAAPQCALIEPPDHCHGDVQFSPDESFADAVARIVAFDQSETLALPDPAVASAGQV